MLEIIAVGILALMTVSVLIYGVSWLYVWISEWFHSGRS